MLNTVASPLIYVYMFPECRLHLTKCFCRCNRKRLAETEDELKMLDAPYLQNVVPSASAVSDPSTNIYRRRGSLVVWHWARDVDTLAQCNGYLLYTIA